MKLFYYLGPSSSELSVPHISIAEDQMNKAGRGGRYEKGGQKEKVDRQTQKRV